jgi:antitoxin YefM
MITTTYTDFRTNMKTYMDRVTRDADNVIINRGNGQAVVIMSLEEYEAIKETHYVLSSPKVMESIKKGEKEIAEGNLSEFNLDEI